MPTGFDGAFKYLARQPYGLWILAVIALGLIAFGLYSFMSAAWFRLKNNRGKWDGPQSFFEKPGNRTRLIL